MAEVAFEDFAQTEIRRLEELRLEALEARIQAERELGRHLQVVAELEAVLAQDATREGVASQLMLTYYRCGRQADALHVYQRTRAHLAAELGLEPGPAIKDLQTRVLEQSHRLTGCLSTIQGPGLVSQPAAQPLPGRVCHGLERARRSRRPPSHAAQHFETLVNAPLGNKKHLERDPGFTLRGA